jgi:hypothetical protein
MASGGRRELPPRSGIVFGYIAETVEAGKQPTPTEAAFHARFHAPPRGARQGLYNIGEIDPSGRMPPCPQPSLGRESGSGAFMVYSRSFGSRPGMVQGMRSLAAILRFFLFCASLFLAQDRVFCKASDCHRTLEAPLAPCCVQGACNGICDTGAAIQRSESQLGPCACASSHRCTDVTIGVTLLPSAPRRPLAPVGVPEIVSPASLRFGLTSGWSFSALPPCHAPPDITVLTGNLRI